MRYQQVEPLGNVIQRYIEALKIKSKLQETSIISNWENFVGRTIAKSTTSIYIKDQILFVKFNSSVIKNELMMLKQELIKRLNNNGNENLVIVDIIFL